MKKIKVFALAAVAVLGVMGMSSCSDDKDPSGEPEKEKVVELNGQDIVYGDAQNIIWTDACVFNGKLYSFVVSLEKTEDGNIEKYELYKSEDGAAWEKVNYTVDGKEGLIGGEGARLVVFNNQLCVWGGLRSKGANIYGGEAEVSEGWMGPAVDSYWRLYTSADGAAFTTSECTLTRGEADYAAMMDMFAAPYANVIVYNGKLVINSGFQIAYGMMQASRTLMVSENGKDFEIITTVDAEGNNVRLPDYMSTMYVLGDKLFIAAGQNNFMSPSYTQSTVYSTTDCITWTAETPAEGFECPAIVNATVLTYNGTAVMFGGESYNEAGALEISKNAYASADGINWSAVEILDTFEGYEGLRNISACIKGDYAYVLGGISTPSMGSYGGPNDADIYSAKAWNMKLETK